MKIQGRNGSSFQLDIVGYEFPELVAQEWDSNWLKIRIEASLPQGAWTVTDPCLLTDEVPQLADWLDDVANQTETENIIHFVEPNLEFEVIRLEDGARHLRIWFGAECRPPWNHPTGLGGDQEYAEFVLADIDLRQAAESHRSQLRNYPQRVEH